MIHAILLAAGLSRRMGRQKLLLPFAGRTVIAHIAGEISRSRAGRTVAVVRAGEADVVEALAGTGVEFAVNEDLEGDMLSSVRCGLRVLPEGPGDGVLAALGDQPATEAGLIDRLIGAFEQAGGGIVVPTHGGRRGHPMVFAMRYRPEVLSGFDGVGLRGLPAAHPSDVREVPTESPAVLSDVDCPEDYLRELRRLEDGH